MSETTKNFLDQINFNRLLGTDKTWAISDIYKYFDVVFPRMLDNVPYHDLYEYLVNRYEKENQALFTEEIAYYIKFTKEENNIEF